MTASDPIHTVPAKSHQATANSGRLPASGPSAQEVQALTVLFAQGRYTEAEALAANMTLRFPQHGFGWMALGASRKQAGRSAEALTAAQTAAMLLPNDANAHSNLGGILKDLGQLAEAEASLRRALSIQPSHAQALSNLAATLQDRGRLDEAEISLRQALKVDPNNIEALNNLGNVLKGLRRFDEALACYEKALEINPRFADAHNNLGATFQELNRLEEAEASYRHVIEINPGNATAHNNLGVVLQKRGLLDASESSYRNALALQPDLAETHINLSSTLIHQGRLHEAEQYCQNAVRLAPDNALALCNLGVVLQDLGQHHAAEACYRRALELKPDFVSAMSNLLFVLNYDPDKSAEEIFATYRKYDADFGIPCQHEWKPHDNSRDINRRLRVGYVSPDFRQHAARHFVEPLLSHHDKRAVEVFAYAELTHEDAVTARYKNDVDHWVPTAGLSDRELAARIRADGIDILVELAGHTHGNRLGVFARKPAPVSLTWLGFGNTSGLSAIDYYLTDDNGAPPGSEALFAETPWRIAHSQFAFRPAEGMGEVSTLPALNNGYVTFCTLTRRIRINHRTIRVWSEILNRVPDSRLVIDSNSFRDPVAREILASEFEQYGIARTRVKIGCQSPPWDVLRNVDIGLDCFPHNSGTTLLETLYMGVPYVTLAGRPHVGRIGASMVRGAGHPEWIAATEDEYIEKAVALAGDLPSLATIRAKLRNDLQASPVMDEVGFARRIEAAYREMFQRWAQSDVNENTNIDRLLQHALALHNAGKLQEAGEHYRNILEADSNHLQANYNLGVLAVQMNRPADGLPYFATALDADPTSAPLWIGYIDALFRAGQQEDARHLLKLAKHQGLEGREVDVLSVKLEIQEIPDSTAPTQQEVSLPSGSESPPARELNALILIFTDENFVDAIAKAHTLTTRFAHHAPTWIILGIALERVGRSVEAFEALSKAVELAPRNADAHLNLGVTLKSLGRLNDAHDSYRTALQINPELAEAHYNLGNTLKDLNQLEEAASSYRKALRWLPNNAGIHSNLGATLLQLGRLKDAESSLRRAVKLQPNFTDAHFNLGSVLLSAHRLDDAEASLRRAIELNPDHAQALFSLGSIQKLRGQLTEAESSYQRALRITPNDAELLTVLGGIQIETNHLADAEANYRRAIQIQPDLVEAHNNLANILVRAGRQTEAEIYLRQALVVKPDYAEAHYNLGNALMDLSRLVEARNCFRRALELNPAYLPARQNLVTLTAYLSDFDELVAASDATLKLDPSASISWEQRLYTFSYHPDLTADRIFAEFVRWGDRFPVPATDFSAHDRTPGRRLRVGFVSPDFRRHTSRFFFFPLFAHHDHAQVELFAYSNVLNEDDATQKFKTLFDHWRNIRGVPDQDVARMVRADRIDILVDGCNHMLDDRLGVFAIKPAPIQVTWLGAAWTTGLKQVDYVMFDPTIAPEGTLARESIVRLPHCFIAYQPENDAPVAPTPALKNGYITFGYSGRTERLNHHTFRVWGELLRRIPDARMIFDYRCFADPATQEHYRGLMEKYGMDPARVAMRRSANIFEGLNDFDVLLDCFPHSGGTMLFDALWMGVPYVTLAGRPPLGRIGTTLLTNLGMTEWIAHSHEDYIDKVIALTRDVQQLANIRVGLRQRMQQSPIMDGKGFARDVEAAYRTMYESWVKGEHSCAR